MKKRILLSALLIPASALLTLLLVEGSSSAFLFVRSDWLRRTNTPPHSPVEIKNPIPFEMPDGLILPKPNSQYTVEYAARSQGQEWSATYRFDKHGRRLSTPPIGSPSRFLAVFGCSFTLGVGVQDQETFPSQLGKQIPNARVYNYGSPGGGPNTILRRMELYPLKEEIAESQGIGLYLFIPDHIRRAIGRMSYVNQWGRNLAHYDVDGESLKYSGTFAQAHPMLSTLFSWLGASSFIQAFSLDFPLPIFSGKEAQQAVLHIDAIRKEFQRSFPGQPFLVLLFPVPAPEYPQLERELRNVSLPYLKLEGVRTLESESPYFPDSHPHPIVYEELAKALGSELRKIGNGP